MTKKKKEEVVEEPAFSLPNEVITVRFIPRKRGMAAEVSDDHVIAGGMLTGSKKKFFAPLQRDGSIANILSKEEKAYIEDVTGLNLSVYGDFWETFSVSLFKENAHNKFDLSNPMDYLQYAILRATKDEIAPSWSERNDKLTYQFVITRDEEVTDEKKARLDTKKDAFKAYGRIEDNKDTLVDVLRLLTNKAISADSKIKWLQGQVEEKLDANPEAFLAVINDPFFETKSLINRGIAKKVILKKDNKYVTVDGLELAEQGEVPTLSNAVRFLANDKNYDIRSLIEGKINEA